MWASAALYPKTRGGERVELYPTGMIKGEVRKIKMTKGEGERTVLEKGAACS